MHPATPHPVLHLVNDPSPSGYTPAASLRHRHIADYRPPVSVGTASGGVASGGLAFGGADFQSARSSAPRSARHAIAKANLLAGGMSPLDARWVMARRVAEQLEGGRAAVLAPDRRRSLIAAAVRLGLREFDANLVIAIVQDGRRIGSGALTLDVESRLALIPQAAPAAPSRLSAWLPVAAAALGLLVCAGLVLWLRTP